MTVHTILRRSFGALTLCLAAVACEASRSPLGTDGVDSRRAAQGNDDFAQVDRIGIPAVNTVFIPSNLKDEFNQSVPSEDRKNFRLVIGRTVINMYGGGAVLAEAIAEFVTPDIQPYTPFTPTAFPNGRGLADDVITTELMLVFGNNAALNDDHVDANDVPFLATFPYLGTPHTQ